MFLLTHVFACFSYFKAFKNVQLIYMRYFMAILSGVCQVLLILTCLPYLFVAKDISRDQFI